MLKELNIFSLPRFLMWLIVGCLVSGCAGSSLPLIGDRAADTQAADAQVPDEQAPDVQAADEGAANTQMADEQAAVAAVDEAEHERPGRQFRDCAQCPEMVVVPAGEFIMGSPSGEEGRYDDEGPQHRVRIGQPFAVGKYEVTRGEFSRFVAATGHSAGGSCWVYNFAEGKWAERSGFGWRNPGFSQTDREPVVCVNWKDAQAYVSWLSDKTGKSYRLLSESEWEYAARAGTVASRHWGDASWRACEYANVQDRTYDEYLREYYDQYVSAGLHACHDGRVHTSPVGSYQANGWGLHDVLGNVWEWVADCWNESYAGAPDDGSVWADGDCVRRVLRGGSWYNAPRILRSAYRLRDVTGLRYDISGFRVARTL